MSPRRSPSAASDAGCPITFRYPTDWGAHRDTTFAEEPCTFTLRPQAWDSLLLAADSVDVYTIELRVIPEGFDAAVKRSAFALGADGRWVVHGRAGAEAPAIAIDRRSWEGVWGTAALGCYRVTGSYLGAGCESPMAFVGTATHSVELVGAHGSEDVFDRILGMLTFRP